MKLRICVVIVAILSAMVVCGWWFLDRTVPPVAEDSGDFTGSAGCRSCHEIFYKKWSTSMHGLAMQPFTPTFARENLIAQEAGIEFRGRVYKAEIGKDAAVVRETGPEGEKTYPIAHALGGKNVFYFLTPWEGGRLQVLPVAYDVRNKEWYNTTGSMVRHLLQQGDEALDWTERPLTFNTSCYNCHVSQLSKNYSLETDTYTTTWTEPGINCEVCHGPGKKHVEKMLAAGDGEPDNLEIIVTGDFTTPQINSMCGPCHAKMAPISSTFRPGERFFDHYNLVALEDRDFHPDGRDLGENFTYTLWLMSPCVASGQLDCMHCHTSSGRNRHAGADADKACLPCHESHVADPAAHSHHAADSEGSRCVTCHMPMTTFARMRRHDHTMLPPTPAATIQFKSPNACNICHEDQDAQWADEWVRKWYPRDYQAPLLHRASLIDAARKEDWKRLPEMIAYLKSPDRNEIFAASLLRILDRCPDPAKWPAFLTSIRDPLSPLIRSSAALGLAHRPGAEAHKALIDATADSYRIVRIRAAAALARRPDQPLDGATRARVEKAFAEYEESMRCQPDVGLSHYNLGLYYQERGDLKAAITEYELANKMYPSFVPAWVNLSMAHAQAGKLEESERALREALRVSPTNAETNFNLGLLLAEQGVRREAETCFRTALKTDPNFAAAAYNLGVLVSYRDLEETIALCRKAAQLRPHDPKYTYTLAFYLRESGDADGAIEVLTALIKRDPYHDAALALLGTTYEETDRVDQALELYRNAVATEELPDHARVIFAQRIASIERR